MFKPVLAVLFFANLALALFNGLPFERPIRQPVKIADFNQFINDFNKRIDNEKINHDAVLKKGININDLPSDLKIDLDDSAASTTSTPDIKKRDVSPSLTTPVQTASSVSSIAISLPSVDPVLSSQISASVSSMLEQMSEKYKSAAAKYTTVTKPPFTSVYN